MWKPDSVISVECEGGAPSRQEKGGSWQEHITESQQLLELRGVEYSAQKEGESQHEQSSEALIDFKRWVPNKQFPKDYRLATFNEVQLHRSKLLWSRALHTWDISRLLDGWIDGPGYANLPVREFRPDLGNCVLIRKNSFNEGDKDEVIRQLDESGKRIAFLFACEVGLKAAETFLQIFEGKLESDTDLGIRISPLHVAIVGGDFDLCCRLVKGGADVNRALGRREAKHFDGISRKKFSGFAEATPLHLAIAFDFEKFVLECLLTCKDLDLQACDEANRTVLHCAALSGNVAILRELLLSSKMIEVQGHDRAGMTVLHFAAAANDSSILQALLQAGNVDVMVKDRDGRSALHVAAASGSVANVILLTKAMKMSDAIWKPDDSGNIPLVYAIEACQCEVIMHFLYGGRQFQEMGEVHRGQEITRKLTPLHYAVYITAREKARRADYHSMLEVLLEHATDRTKEMIDLFWDGGDDSLHFTSGKNVRVLQLLVKYLVRAERAEPFVRETSFQRAAKAGYVPLVRLLLQYERDPVDRKLVELENEEWTKTLTKEEDEHVLDVKNICETEHQSTDSLIKEFGRKATDQPALDDSLGRRTLVEGLATLLLNPFTGTPLTIGIYGEWGHGKSSLMKQIEVSLCTIAIQQAFIHPLINDARKHRPAMNAHNFTDKGKEITRAVANAVKELVGEDKKKKNSHDLSEVGYGQQLHRAYKSLRNTLLRVIHRNTDTSEPSDEANILDHFVKNYDQQHHRAYKSLALTDTSELFKPPEDIANGDKPRTPAVLTVWYNAWQYQNETEALAGLAVEIIKEMESAMNMALWMNMCWSYAWSKNRQELYIKLFFPVSIVGLLSVLFSTVLWKLLSMSSILNIYKYTAPPICFLVLLWTTVVRLYKTVQPVSCKLFEYFNPMQHQTKLGYQHQVIADIKFMMTALCTKPPPIIWRLFAKCKWIWFILGLEDHDYVAGTRIFKQTPASDVRIVVLVDDLDRCNDGTILKVLCAINLVLSVCEINVILGIDKTMIHRALKNEIFNNERNVILGDVENEIFNNDRNGDSSTEYARKFLQKIVQLPITIPDPTNKQMGQFLARQMGFVHKSRNYNKPQRREGAVAVAETEDGDDDESFGVEELDNTLLDRCTAQECNILVYLQGCTHHDQRLPREWKRFLNYHRFACNIMSKNPATQTFPDWKIELLVWVFVCWQWKNLMDTIIQDWPFKEGKIQNGDTIQQAIVNNEAGVSGDVGDDNVAEASGAVGDDNVAGASGDVGDDNVARARGGGDIQRDADTEISLLTISKKFSKLKKGDDHHNQSWKSLLKVLEKYNVSMKGIQIFQEFRFNCKRGNLPSPTTGNLEGRRQHRLRSMISHE